MDSLFSDTVSKVIQHRRRRPRGKRPATADVNNFAAPEINSGEKLLRPKHIRPGRIAPDGSRSSVSHPLRIKRSSPARPAAPVSTSERTIAREAPGIRSTHDGATMHAATKYPMKEWKDITHYAGFDWALDHHVVVIVDPQGQIAARARAPAQRADAAHEAARLRTRVPLRARRAGRVRGGLNVSAGWHARTALVSADAARARRQDRRKAATARGTGRGVAAGGAGREEVVKLCGLA